MMKSQKLAVATGTAHKINWLQRNNTMDSRFRSLTLFAYLRVHQRCIYGVTIQHRSAVNRSGPGKAFRSFSPGILQRLR
ncbi:MAG: hypothetical protein OEV91_05290, partial [Desulfobulbaceae bacterium]|nr:hypothetical protein [Desulfobulbaceae bacterium]